MQRIIALIGIAFVSTLNLSAQTVDMPRPYRGLSGLSSALHTAREESYNCSGDAAEKPWRVFEVTLDRRGKVTSQANFNSDGSVGHQASFIFDNDGNMTGWSEFYGKGDFPPDGLHKNAVITLSGRKPISSIVYKEREPEFKTTLEYDERGNKIREVTVTIGCCTTTRTFKYDAQNRPVENTYDSSGLNYVQRRTYDAVGNVISETQYEKGVLLWTTIRTFDDRRLTKEVITPSDGNIRTTQNTYNKSGNPTLSTIDDKSIESRTAIDYYGNDKIRTKDQVTFAKIGGVPQHSEAAPTPGRILEKHDTAGNQIERYIYDAKGDLYLTQMSSYDDQGNQIRLVETSRLGSMYDRDLVYEFDSHGNRIAAFCRNVTATGEVKLSLSEKRIITYYKN